MLQPGSQIGRYEIQRRLGRGGMGTVYVAHDPVLGRMVAIKLFRGDLDLPDAAERFAREARSAAALNHANIVTVHDFGDVASQPYIVMEYVQGETLADVIRRKAVVGLADKLRWIEELCAGAAYAHQFSVIHRDIKPTNLMLDRTGRLKILDFGIAKMLGTLGSSATALIGTPGYMAPEQILGSAVDHRSDLFSIGVVCYELLAYKEAFPGETIPTITHKILNEDPAPLVHLVPDINPELMAAVECALKKKAADRFPDAESFRQAINRVRRQIESEPGWDGATMPLRGASAPSDDQRRGTGSARRSVPDAIGVAELTPPPEPRRVDREALARRRASQVEAALLEARASLDAGDLEQALDACEQALTLDDTNPLAIELEESVKLAIDRQKAGVLIAEARTELGRGALTAAMTLLEQARALDPEASDARRLDRDLRLARVEQEERRQRAEAASQSLAAATQALGRGEVEAALASARKALALDPESSQARSLEAEAMRRLNEGVEPSGVHVLDKTVLAPPKRTPAPPPTGAKRTPAPPPAAKRTPAPTPAKAKRPATAPPAARRAPVDRFAPLRAFAASVQAAIDRAVVAAKPHSRTIAIAGASVAALVVAVVGAVLLLRPGGPLPTGTLVVEALPWATITAVEAADGSSVPLPPPAATPFAMALPAGTYTVRLTGPPPDSEPRVLSVQIQENGVAVMPVERFRAVTPEEYFEQYLMTPSPSATSPADTPVANPAAPPPAEAATPPAGEAAAPAAPAKPPGAAQ